jgi:3'-phosphoadenosine 5'-phosphosulfate sulfotransferase (PAPS reductase)/FAD synthetase
MYKKNDFCHNWKSSNKKGFDMKEYHVLSLSGGKDSTALAFYLKDNMPEVHEKIEYVFSDTECELPETYDYLDKIEIFLDKPIKRLKPYKSFDHLLQIYKYLPSANRRWCTLEMKTKTFRHYISTEILKDKDALAYLYIGIRADEPSRINRYKEIGDDKNIKTVHSLFDAGITQSDVMELLENSGIGLPDYYKWRTRSGCYFCFYQRRMEWVGLYEQHPDLFKKAVEYEKINKNDNFTWLNGISLEALMSPENIEKIKTKHRLKLEKNPKKFDDKLVDIFASEDESEDYCPLCS